MSWVGFQRGSHEARHSHDIVTVDAGSRMVNECLVQRTNEWAHGVCSSGPSKASSEQEDAIV
jgi:hypothetical protein